MKEIKMNVNQFEGLAVTVEVKGNIDEYAKSFLHIFNNVRENKELLKVENHYSNNDVTVYCMEGKQKKIIVYIQKINGVIMIM